MKVLDCFYYQIKDYSYKITAKMGNACTEMTYSSEKGTYFSIQPVLTVLVSIV